MRCPSAWIFFTISGYFHTPHPEEKSCLHIPFFQTFQKCLRMIRIWSIIKGQSHFLNFLFFDFPDAAFVFSSAILSVSIPLSALILLSFFSAQIPMIPVNAKISSRNPAALFIMNCCFPLLFCLKRIPRLSFLY